ncbi:MAG: SDR family oxidoreductase [Acidobacteriota bacterium]|nr:SDR family oxidoreductase [Acidobacteriota bacterium]
MSKSVIISGATKGLGKELSFAFGKSGYQVFGFFRSDEKVAALMREEFSSSGLKGEFIQNDITHEGHEIWEKINAEAESLTLINNACAPFEPKPVHLLKWDDFQMAIEVAVKGSILCAQAVMRTMVRHRRGAIVSILTSALTDIPPKGFSAYLVAKASLQALNKSLAAELSHRGIRVFSVSPSYLETSLTANWDPRLRAKILAHGIRPQDPAFVAAYILGLVEDPNVPGRGEDYVAPDGTIQHLQFN